MTAAPDSIDYKKFHFSQHAMTVVEEETPQELLERVWEDLSERRRKRACARCGWFVSCSIQEISKHDKYKIHAFWELKPNTLDKNITGDICRACGVELVGGLLGTTSQRTKNLSNRTVVENNLRIIRSYVHARKTWNRDYVRLCHRLERIKNSKIEMENPQEMIEDIVKSIEDRKRWVGIVEGKIDRLVSIYNIK